MPPDRQTRLAEQNAWAQHLAGADPIADMPWRIHRNTIWQAWLDGMADAYPVCRRIIGDDAFFHAARTYLLEHPPATAALKWIGAGFAEHLARIPDLTDLAYLADMARLERAWLEAFHAPDDNTLTLDDMASVPVETLLDCVMKFHSSVRFVSSAYPIKTIYELHESGEIDRPELSVTLTPEHTYLIVTRPGLDVKIHAVTGDCFRLGQQLDAGQSIGEALAQFTSIQAALGDLQFLMGCQLASSLRERPQEQ